MALNGRGLRDMNDPVESAVFNEAMCALSLSDRRIATFYMNGYTLEEIADKMGMSTTTVHCRLKGMKTAFRDVQ